ncbi:MAG: RagB/SusD family nutrient uptake outer membrane protein [Tannerellaceae bacterium]|nr:RagB/SusD family nutrient uptake outer membrane protein [Tannerellaceae bacterium]MCD8263288.1 RagB/SusD family nutrient uptake outer membrane protein [Tannerellaceae bacterium]
MKKYNIIVLLISVILGFTACGDDFLTNSPTQSKTEGADADEQKLNSFLAAAYQILLMDSYADNNYNSLPILSDLRSDDIFKGGSDAGDQGSLYRLATMDVDPNETPKGLWKIYYSGISRCNTVLEACEASEGLNQEVVDQIIDEARFLRAYYTHWLWKFWGNIPYFREELADPYMAKQYKADEIYAFIMEDIDFILSRDNLPMKTSAREAGRVTKAAAMMLKARVIMYQKDQNRYAEVMNDMQAIVSSGEYRLLDDFQQIWLREGEFCDESIFEVNHLPDGKTWGTGWFGYGTNLPAFIGPNELQGKDPFIGGWGFCPVRPGTYTMYEEGDVRRDISVNHFKAVPSGGELGIDGDYKPRFQDTGYFWGKYAARAGYNNAPGDQDLNFENNLRIFRYAEVLLNIADLQVIQGVANTGKSAQSCLDDIRSRAGLNSIPATVENIKQERRLEFVGEGFRFWDLVRWGDTSILTENLSEYYSVRTWEDYKKYLPIPQDEIDRTEGEFRLVQNPGY